MKVRLMKVKTNASTMLIVEVYDTCDLYILDNAYTNSEECTIKDIEDWSSWDRWTKEERYTLDTDEWLGCNEKVFDKSEILEDLIKEI